jgi:hypothetical protein
LVIASQVTPLCRHFEMTSNVSLSVTLNIGRPHMNVPSVSLQALLTAISFDKVMVWVFPSTSLGKNGVSDPLN